MRGEEEEGGEDDRGEHSSKFGDQGENTPLNGLGGNHQQLCVLDGFKLWRDGREGGALMFTSPQSAKGQR